MRTVLPFLVAGAIVAACQPPATEAPAAEPAGEPVVGATPPVVPAGGSATALPPVTDVPQGEPRWMVSQDGENRFLAFAVPETDDVRFSLECGPNERFVRLWRETTAEDQHDFRLSSGNSSPIIAADYDPEGMAPQLTGVAAARIPVFLNFRQTGQLTLTTMGQTHDLSASPMARPLIEDFFTYCGPPTPAG